MTAAPDSAATSASRCMTTRVLTVDGSLRSAVSAQGYGSLHFAANGRRDACTFSHLFDSATSAACVRLRSARLDQASRNGYERYARRKLLLLHHLAVDS